MYEGEDYYCEDEDEDFEDEEEDELDEDEEGDYIEKLSGSFDNSTGFCFGDDDFAVTVAPKKEKSVSKK